MSVVAWLCVLCTVCMFGLEVECMFLVFPCCVVLESLRQRVSLCFVFVCCSAREDGADFGVFVGSCICCIYRVRVGVCPCIRGLCVEVSACTRACL